MKLYSELAHWWPILSAPEDYAEEVAFFWQALSSAGLPAAPTYLELGSGGGNNALHFKPYFAQMTLTDVSPQMLAVSRALNPTCEHIAGDMRSVRLGRVFDVVFVHDAIDYMTTLSDLRRALETAATHCKPGGLGLFVPDHVRETFEPATEHGGGDGDGRALRYLEWAYDPDPTDTLYTVEYAYLLREGTQPARCESEQHLCGLFPHAEWLELLQAVGFQPEVLQDEFGREVFLGRKRAL